MSAPHGDHEGDALAVSAQDEYYHNARERSIDDDLMEEYSEKPPPPPKKKFYKNKKYWIICGILSAIVIIVVVCLIVFVFFPMIVQSLMNQAGIDVNGADITFSPPQQQSSGQMTKRDTDPEKVFYMDMKSTLKNTGPFSADIVFHNPILVYYNNTLLGNITLPGTSIGGGKGDLNAQTPFLIQDPTQFAAFSKDMLALDSFDWQLKGSCDVTALSRTSTASLDKTVTIPGMGGFKDVKINSFQLPANDPNGGIKVELGTVMASPSPVGIQLGTIQLQIGYQGVNLGMVSAENVTLKKGDNTIPLKGTIIPQNSTADLEKVGVMFSTYVSGGTAQTSATGVSAAPDGKNSISWLTDAFKSVQLNVGLSNAGGPLKIINAVNMGYLDLKFDSNNPYAPTVSAPNVVADFSIPFGFTLNITQVTQNITMNTNSTGNFSELNVPWVPSQSNQDAGKLQFPINGAALAALPGKDDAFNSYTYDLTSSDLYTFGVSGLATTITKTPIGEIKLGGISFAVPTSLHGLQFLNSTPTEITSVDMTGGTSQALQLDIGVKMGNPSDFSMSVGDVTFAMFAGSTQVGTVTLANLTLQRGDNKVIAKANFDPKSSDAGQKMLSTFVMGQNNSASIGGYDGSTAVASLAKALSVIKIDTTLPGLAAPLIQNGNLKVLPNTIQTSIVNVAVTIANPFTAGLAITKVKSAATYKGMPVGNIDQDISGNPFVINGHANGTSQDLDMKMNLEPAAVALLMRDLAVDANLDTKALDALLGMGGFHIQGQEDVQPEASIFKGFNISSYVLNAMKALKVDLNLESGLQVGEYEDTLAFSQKKVQINADDSVTRLIPIVGQPIVQQIVNAAVLGFETLILSSPTESNAKVQMKGSITKSGPMDATISFPSPLTVRWQGKTLGTATMPDLNAVADQGAQFDVPSNFVITDKQAMQDFAAFMINQEEFTWDIVSNDVAVTALGFTFTGIKMEKFVKIKGCNGFKGAVTINSFNLPSNDPSGGITLVADTTINNPSQVGFNLNSVAFNSYYEDVLVGPLGASPGNFAPAGPSKIKMQGRMIPQKSQHGLDIITKVFETYLNASDSKLDVQGDSASGPTGQVSWLTQAFKTLKIQDVILPGPKEKPVLIPSITMMNLELDYTKDPYAAPASSTQVQAQLKNPFGFPLGVSQLNMEVDAKVGSNKMAHLSIPTEKATTDSNQLVKTQFSDVPFKVADDAHSTYSDFVAALTKSGNTSFGLSGTSNALTTTAVGNLQLDGITFDVTTALAGFNNFDGKCDIVSLKITGGTKEYTIVETVVAFNNPSQITITVGDISFIAKSTTGANTGQVGQVFIKDTVIKPGRNQYNAEFHLAGDGAAVGQLFTNYLTNVKVPLGISGTETSTSIEPLKKAFGSVTLDTMMQGIEANLISGVKVSVSIGQLLAKKASATVTLRNPLDTAYVLTKLKAEVYFPGKGGSFKVGEVDSIPESCNVPAKGQVTCPGPWDVNMVASIPQLLEVITASDKSMDMNQTLTATVGGDGGYEASFFYYMNHVPTELDIDLGIFDLPLGGKLNSTESGTFNQTSKASATDSKATSTKITGSGDKSSDATPTDDKSSSKPTETAGDKSSDKPTATSGDKSSDKPTEAPSKSSDSGSSDKSAEKDKSEATTTSKDHFIFPF